MKAVILQSNYITWKGYFDLIHDADIFVFYDEVKYTKDDWRNRNKIYTKNGIRWLSIPVYRDAVKQKISEVIIKDSRWQEKHFKSIYLGYKSAPFFSQLEPVIVDIYKSNEWKYLSEMNQYVTKKIATILGIKTPFVNSKDYVLHTDRMERIYGLLRQVGADEIITGERSKNYLGDKGEELFLSNGFKLTYKKYKYPAYKQLSNPFRNDVSILDLIANIKLDEIKNYIWEVKSPDNE